MKAKQMTRMTKLTSQTVAALLCTSVLALTGCGSSFSGSSSPTAATPAASGGSNTGSGTGSGGAGTGTTTPVPPVDSRWQSATMDGKIGGNQFFPAFQVVRLDKASKQLVLSLPIPNGMIVDGVGVEVPLDEIPGAMAGVELQSDGSSALVLRVPLDYLMKGVDSLPSNRLPNGDALPMIPDGELPSMALQIGNAKRIQATIYLSVQTLGIYISAPFDPYLQLTLAILGPDSKVPMGFVTSVPAHKKPRPVTAGGFFISVKIPDDLARIIDDNL